MNHPYSNGGPPHSPHHNMQSPHDSHKEVSTAGSPPPHGYASSYHQQSQGYHQGLEVNPVQVPDSNPNGKAAHYHWYAPPVPETKTICGVRRSTFILSVALLIVIIAAAIGGGVGGSMAVSNAQKSCLTANGTAAAQSQGAGAGAGATSTVTTTVTTTASPTSGGNSASSTSGGRLVVPTGVLALDCPNLNNQQQTITLGKKSWKFNVECATDYGDKNLSAVIVYSFHDCLQACAAHNAFSGKEECLGVHFGADMSTITNNFGNCWLKGVLGDKRSGVGNMDAFGTVTSS